MGWEHDIQFVDFHSNISALPSEATDVTDVTDYIFDSGYRDSKSSDFGWGGGWTGQIPVRTVWG